MKLNGYYNHIGYVLITDNGGHLQFDTESEAMEYVKEEEERKIQVKNRYILYVNENGDKYIVLDTLYNKTKEYCKNSNSIEEIIEIYNIQAKNIKSGKPL